MAHLSCRIPNGVAAILMSLTGFLSRYISPKWLILLGHTLLIIATILLSFADSEDKYWRLMFPGLIIASGGSMLAYSQTSIAVFEASPPAVSGIVGAIFNCGLQLGAAVGLAIDTAIETSVERTHGGFQKFNGRRATLLWQVGISVVSAIAILVFYRVKEDNDEFGEESTESIQVVTENEEKGDEKVST